MTTLMLDATTHDIRRAQLLEQVAEGEYRVNEPLIAEAIVQHLLLTATRPAAGFA